MTTKYEIIEGDHWKLVASFDNLNAADLECARLNRKYNRGYFVQRNINGTIAHRSPAFRQASERIAARRLDLEDDA